MHNIVKNLLDVENNIKQHLNELKVPTFPKIIAVSKTFNIDKIRPLIQYGHKDFGENKVQEAIEKWAEIKKFNSQLKLHMIGKLQTNKVKFAVKLFDYIHSVDNEKLAKKIADEQFKENKKIKIFLQVNIGEEDQKSGIKLNALSGFMKYLRNNTNLEIKGLMCIPPVNKIPNHYFEQMQKLNIYYLHPVISQRLLYFFQITKYLVVLSIMV